MEEKIDGLRALAQDALKQYGNECAGGGEPAYPAWADDLIEVCRVAEAALRLISH